MRLLGEFLHCHEWGIINMLMLPNCRSLLLGETKQCRRHVTLGSRCESLDGEQQASAKLWWDWVVLGFWPLSFWDNVMFAAGWDYRNNLRVFLYSQLLFKEQVKLTVRRAFAQFSIVCQLSLFLDWRLYLWLLIPLSPPGYTTAMWSTCRCSYLDRIWKLQQVQNETVQVTYLPRFSWWNTSAQQTALVACLFPGPIRYAVFEL